MKASQIIEKTLLNAQTELNKVQEKRYKLIITEMSLSDRNKKDDILKQEENELRELILKLK